MRGLWLRQNEQVQERKGVSSGRFVSRSRTWILPQWQPPRCSMAGFSGAPAPLSTERYYAEYCMAFRDSGKSARFQGPIRHNLARLRIALPARMMCWVFSEWP